MAFVSVVIKYIHTLILRFLPSNKDVKASDYLFIKTDAIGDFILFCEYFHNVGDVTPTGTKIHLLINEINAPLAELLLDDDVIVHSVRMGSFYTSFRSITGVLSQLKSVPFLKVYNCCYSRTVPVDLCVFALRSRLKIGWTGDASNQREFFRRVGLLFYTQKLESNELNECVFNETLLRHAFSHYHFRKWSKSCGVEKDTPDISENSIIVFLGSSMAGKTWHHDNFVKVIEYLLLQNKEVILMGGDREYELSRNVIDSLGGKQGIVDLVNRLSLPEVLAVVEKAQLAITSDTFIVHAANLFKTPSIVILGGGHFGRFFPLPFRLREVFPTTPLYEVMECYNCGWKCRYNETPFPCVSSITSDAVITELQKMGF